jgi:hypothetical protein
MTTEVEVELARLDNVLYVPVAAVFSSGGKTFCYRVEDGDYEKVYVTLGRMNSTQVQILSGLKEGEEVLLAPPKGEQVDTGEVEGEDDAEKDDSPAGSPGATGQGGSSGRRQGQQGQGKPSGQRKPSGQGGRRPQRSGGGSAGKRP